MSMTSFESLVRISVTLVTLALTACATAPPDNPWRTVSRSYDPGPPEEAAKLKAMMQPCIDYARETFPQAVNRFDAGLPAGTQFAVVTRDERGATFYVLVTDIEGSQIEGKMANEGRRVGGRVYAYGEKYTLSEADVADWLFVYPDRPEEGNLLGKYLLLRQDGLISGACNPQHVEFKRFRFFEMDYSFVPPDVEGWDVRGKEMVPGAGFTDFSMQESGDSPNELNTLYAERLRSQPFETDQQFVDKMRATEKQNLGDPDRYTLLEHDVAAYTEHDTSCVRSHQVIDDKKALLSKSGDRGPMIREILSLYCVLPLSDTVVVNLTYAHRYLPGHRDPGFPGKADVVFKSLAFKIQSY